MEERTGGVRGGWAGRQMGSPGVGAGMPTYSLPSTGVVVPVLAAALELPLQPGQNLQLPQDGASSQQVAWHKAEASQVADVLDIVQCGYPGGKGQLGARGHDRLVAGAGPELVVWLRSFLLEAGESSLPLLFAAPVGSGLNRELGLTELGQCILPLEQEGRVSAAAHRPAFLAGSRKGPWAGRPQRSALCSPGAQGRPKRRPATGTRGSDTARPRALVFTTHTYCLGFQGHPQDREPSPYHELCTLQAVRVVVTAAAAGISCLQEVEGLPLATQVGVARLWQVPRAVHHVLTSRKADLVQTAGRRPPGGEAFQPVAPASAGSARLAVLGWIRIGLAHEGRWLY